MAPSGISCDSTDLVPGDIVNLSSSQLSIVPADIFLLSGDAIINESMLTGESVPVSKAAAKDVDIFKWKDEKSENPKTFLYGGTRVVRIRGIMSSVGQERPSLGLVTRTGGLNSLGFLRRITSYSQVSTRQKAHSFAPCCFQNQSGSNFTVIRLDSLESLLVSHFWDSVSVLLSLSGWG
jgi:magnesium-transporting ATPase (P-type)